MGSSLNEYWKKSFGFVTEISNDDWVLWILGNSLYAAGQMIGPKKFERPMNSFWIKNLGGVSE
jgi:hypothetical protein